MRKDGEASPDAFRMAWTLNVKAPLGPTICSPIHGNSFPATCHNYQLDLILVRTASPPVLYTSLFLSLFYFFSFILGLDTSSPNLSCCHYSKGTMWRKLILFLLLQAFLLSSEPFVFTVSIPFSLHMHFRTAFPEFSAIDFSYILSLGGGTYWRVYVTARTSQGGGCAFYIKVSPQPAVTYFVGMLFEICAAVCVACVWSWKCVHSCL